MLTTVLAINGLLSLVCLAAAWWIWQQGQKWSRIANMLTAVEREVVSPLRVSSRGLATGQTHLRQLRQQSQQIALRLDQVRQVFILLRLSQILWQQFWRTPLTEVRPEHHRK